MNTISTHLTTRIRNLGALGTTLALTGAIATGVPETTRFSPTEIATDRGGDRTNIPDTLPPKDKSLTPRDFDWN